MSDERKLPEPASLRGLLWLLLALALVAAALVFVMSDVWSRWFRLT